MVCYDRTILAEIQLFENLNLIWWVQKNLNIEKITFKVVQMKFLAMHINSSKVDLQYYIYKISLWNMIFI